MKKHKRLITLFSILSLLCVVYYYSVLLPGYKARNVPLLNHLQLSEQIYDNFIKTGQFPIAESVKELEQSRWRIQKHMQKLEKQTILDKLLNRGL